MLYIVVHRLTHDTSYAINGAVQSEKLVVNFTAYVYTDCAKIAYPLGQNNVNSFVVEYTIDN